MRVYYHFPVSCFINCDELKAACANSDSYSLLLILLIIILTLISQVVHHGKEKSSEDPEVGFSSYCLRFLEGNDDPGF